MTRTFVDSAGLYALHIASDPRHQRALDLVSRRAKPASLVLTDYIVQETVTLFKARRHPAAIPKLFALIEGSRAFELHFIDESLFAESRDFLLGHPDKEWSFVDCSSFVLMGKLGIRDALTTDRHFAQSGFRPLLA